MCNLYSITTNQEAIRRLFAVLRDLTGNLPPLPTVFPDGLAPVVRTTDDERELVMMRWRYHAPVSRRVVPKGSAAWYFRMNQEDDI